MFKTVRNTVFTALALALTAVGLGWNQEITRQRDPVTIGQAVLAGNSEAGSGKPPLEIKIGRPNIKLNQYQTVSIETLPNASLDIVTVYPNGSVDNPQTLKAIADDSGRFELKFKLDDWRHLGLFRVIVVTEIGGQTNRLERYFVLQTWAEPQRDLAQPTYAYPLLP